MGWGDGDGVTPDNLMAVAAGHRGPKTATILIPMTTTGREEGTAGELPIWNRFPDIALGLLRLVAGLMLVQHGVQKHFGWLLPADRPFAGAPAAFSQDWIAGTLEVGGGLLLAAGLFTRPVAFVLSGLMAAAYFLVHAPQGFWPIQNGGELAALYSFVFLMFAAVGGGRYSADAVLGRGRTVELNRAHVTTPPSMQAGRRKKDRVVARDS